MIIVNLTGGLGNQLFQYAFGKHLAMLNNCELKLDISSYENYEWHEYSLSPFNVDNNFISTSQSNYYRGNELNLFQRLYRKLFGSIMILEEDNFRYNSAFINSKAPIYLSGYWQSEKYFKEIESVIRNNFQIVLPPTKKNQDFIEIMQLQNSVSLHVRRGNYVNVSHVNQTHGTSSLEYYNLAVELISSKINNPVFYVFSDDILWAKENINLNFETVFVDINDAKSDYEDMRLMASCKHNITANSTFSWWGAWLNSNNDKIVISPKIWFNDKILNSQTQDLIPPNWIRL